MRKIYFDEAGYSGNNLLDNSQPLYCYLGIEDVDGKLKEKFLNLKNLHRYKTDLEIKGANLSKSVKGQKFLIDLWNTFGNECKFVLHDKKFALACKMFEYVYEPVYSNVNTLFYQINFHKFIATSMYNLFMNSDHSAEQLFNGFYQFIKNKGNESLDKYIQSCGIVETSPLYYFSLFCEKHKTEIASDIDFTDKREKFILDLTLTSLYNLLGIFSNGNSEAMEIHCDNSKPIANDKSFWKAFVGNTRIVYDTELGSGTQLTFNLSQEPILDDSKTIIQLQVADMLASSVYQAYLHPDSDFSKKINDFSKNSYVEAYSVAPVDLQMAYDEHEKQVFHEIIRLLSSSKSKKQKIEKLAEKSYSLKYYQVLRNQYIAEYINNFKLIK